MHTHAALAYALPNTADAHESRYRMSCRLNDCHEQICICIEELHESKFLPTFSQISS